MTTGEQIEAMCCCFTTTGYITIQQGVYKLLRTFTN